MDRALIDRIARSVLYEGYTLYPYRASALKNARRWTFGTLYPESWVVTRGGSDRSAFRAQIVFAGPASAWVSIVARYLDGDVEREIHIDTPVPEGRRLIFPNGELTYTSTPLETNTHRLTITVRNIWEAACEDSEAADRNALTSAHAVVSVSEGELVSPTDPPANLAAYTASCVNEGVWPVLIGSPGDRDTMLAAPIILPDYPEVAPESAADLCDATEIEEILTLRILTLTDEEKAEIRASGQRARRILEGAEQLPAEHLMKLHGTIRGLTPPNDVRWSDWDNWANGAVVESVRVNGADLKAGDRVRLRPSKRADILDTALDGRIAVIAGIEQDFEDTIHVAVVVEDDPGRDLGEQRQTGHRFFFSPEEIELP